MQGIQRKITYVLLYEGLAIVCASTGLAVTSESGLMKAGAASVMASAIAVAWNFAFNGVFEWWEARQAVRGRSVGRRVAHALGFEGGLGLILIPVFAWWLDVSLQQALAMEAGLMLFFLVYTFGFNWGFDRLFGLPASAAGAPQPTGAG
ncbi:MAG: PACE efflux transporter [Xenophilus sp.]